MVLLQSSKQASVYAMLKSVESKPSRAVPSIGSGRPYGKRLIESPRQGVFAGAVNHSSFYEMIPAGAYWPVAIDIDSLSRDCDQLWTVAKVRLDAGSVWWLQTGELAAAATQEQAERFDGDP